MTQWGDHADDLIYRCGGCGRWRWELHPHACLICHHPAERKDPPMTTESPLSVAPNPWKPYHRPCPRCGVTRSIRKSPDMCQSCRSVNTALDKLPPDDSGWVNWVRRGHTLYPVGPRPIDEEWAS